LVAGEAVTLQKKPENPLEKLNSQNQLTQPPLFLIVGNTGFPAPVSLSPSGSRGEIRYPASCRKPDIPMRAGSFFFLPAIIPATIVNGTGYYLLVI